MITGFNPADMYAADHIRRVLTTFPGVFTGIGEFRIHKEFVSAKICRRNRQPHQPCARPDPRLRRRSRARRDHSQRHRHAVREAGHRTGVPGQMKALLQASPEHHDHLGARRPRPDRPSCPELGGSGRAPSPHATADRRGHVDRSRDGPPVLRHLVGRGREIRGGLPRSDRARAGDVEPASRSLPVRNRHRGAVRAGAVLRRVRHVGPVWQRSTPDASLKVRKGNYERLFDQGRQRVRAWEAANVK